MNNNEFDDESGEQPWSEQKFQGNINDVPMPRKAISRQPTMETNFPAEEPGPDLNYGVYNEDDQQYAQYAPVPSKSAAQKHMRQSMQKSEKTVHSEGANPIKTVLFQFASMLPGMRIRMEGRKAEPQRDDRNSFRAPAEERSGPRPQAKPANDFAPAQLHRKNALDDLKRDEPGRGGGRDVGTLEQSPIAKFMEKLFPSNNDDYNVQEVEDPSAKRKKTMMRFGALGVFALIVFGAYKMIPRQTDYFEKYPVDFQSAEKERSVKVIDANSAVYAIGADNSKMPITYFRNDWRDFADVVLSSPFQKQIWLEKTEHGVKDLNSNFEMFEQRAPETVSSKEAQTIAENVTAYFNKTHTYPTKGSELGKYFNPYTEKSVPIEIKQVTEGDTKSGEDVDSKRTELYRQLVFEKAKIETKQAPGTIACWNVHFLAAHQDLNVFIIKPYGKNGDPIIGGHTDAQYFIALEDGAPKDLLPAKPLADWIGKDGILHKQTVLFVNHTDSIVLFILKHAAKIFFTIIAFGAAGFLMSLKRGDSPIFWIVVLVLSGVPALLALFGNFIP